MKTLLALVVSIAMQALTISSQAGEPNKDLIVDIEGANQAYLSITKGGVRSPAKRLSAAELAEIAKVLETGAFVERLGNDKWPNFDINSCYYLSYPFQGNEVLRTGDVRRYWVSLDFRFVFLAEGLFQLDEQNSTLLKKLILQHIDPTWKPDHNETNPHKKEKQNRVPVTDY